MAIVASSDNWPRYSKKYDEKYKCVVFEDKSEDSVKFKIGYKVDNAIKLTELIYVYVENEKIDKSKYNDISEDIENIYTMTLLGKEIYGYKIDDDYYKTYSLKKENIYVPPFDIDAIVSYWDNYTKKVIECKFLKSKCKITNVRIKDNKYYSFTIDNKEYVLGNEDEVIRNNSDGFIITGLTPDTAEMLTHPIPESLKLNSKKFEVTNFNEGTFYTYNDIEVGKWVTGKMYKHKNKFYIISNKAKNKSIILDEYQLFQTGKIRNDMIVELFDKQLYYVINSEKNIFKKLTQIYEKTVWCCNFNINDTIHFLDKKDASVRDLTIGNIKIEDNFYIFTSDPKTMICDNQDNVPDKIYDKINGFLLTNATNVSEWSEQKKKLIVLQKFSEIHKEVDKILQIKTINIKNDIITPVETDTQNLKIIEDEYIRLYSKLNIDDIQLDHYHKLLKNLCDYLDKKNYVEKIKDLTKMKSTVDNIIENSSCDSDPNCDKIEELYKRKQQIVDDIVQHNKQKNTFDVILKNYKDIERINLKKIKEIKEKIKVLLQQIQFQKVFIDYIKKQLDSYNVLSMEKYIEILNFTEILDLPSNLSSFNLTIKQNEEKIIKKLRKVEKKPEILKPLTPEQIKNNNEFINHVYQMLKHKHLKYLYYATKYDIPIEPSVITQFDNLTLIFSGGNYYELYKKNKLAYNNIYYNMYVTNKKKYEIISHL